jgi:hypothetical protein
MPLYPLNITAPLSLPPQSGKNTIVALATASTVIQVVQPDPSRLGLTIQNLGNRTVYLGFSNAVSVANYAIALAPGQAYEFPNSYSGGVWGISERASQSVNVVEMS